MWDGRMRRRSMRAPLVPLLAGYLLLALAGRAVADPVKMVVAADPDQLRTIASAIPEGVEITGLGWRGSAVLVVTPRGLRALESEAIGYVVIDSDLTECLRGLGPDMGEYHTYQESCEELERIEREYPELVRIHSIGRSIQGRQILAAEVLGPQASEDVPSCLIVGLHHAREIITPEVVLQTLQRLVRGYDEDEQIRYLLNHRDVWLIPMLNPDGHVMVERGTDWRKNMRDNLDGTFGVDLNRNYSYQWGCDDIGSSPYTWDETYRGTAPFSEPETQAIRELREAQHFKVSLSFHSFGNIVFYPWSWQASLCPMHWLYATLSSLVSSPAGYNFGNAALGMSYLANGEFDDWNFAGFGMESATFGLTFEVGDRFYEPEERIKPLSDESTRCCLNAIRAAGPWIELLQHRIVEEEPDWTIRPNERFWLELLLQSFSVSPIADVHVTCYADGPLLTVSSSPATLGNLAPLERVGPEKLRFEAVCNATQGASVIATVYVNVQARGYDRLFEVEVPVGVRRDAQIAYWDFERESGWEAQGGWQRGSPVGAGGRQNGNPEPSRAFSGDYAFGTIVGGDVIDEQARMLLVSPEFSCRGYSCTGLSFETWLNIGPVDRFRASVEVGVDGRWEVVWQSLGEVLCSSWLPVFLDLSRWADGQQSVRLRFSLVANGYMPYSGWYIDDVRVFGCRLSESTRSQSAILPFAFATPDGLVDTVVVVQNRTEHAKSLKVLWSTQRGQTRTSYLTVPALGMTTLSASSIAISGLATAELIFDSKRELHISALLIDLNSRSFSSIDLLPASTQKVDLQTYYFDDEAEAASYLVLSNHNGSGPIVAQVTVRNASGQRLCMFEEMLGPDAVRPIRLDVICGPGLGWISVSSSEEGLGASGVITFGEGGPLCIMSAFAGEGSE